MRDFVVNNLPEDVQSHIYEYSAFYFRLEFLKLAHDTDFENSFYNLSFLYFYLKFKKRHKPAANHHMKKQMKYDMDKYNVCELFYDNEINMDQIQRQLVPHVDIIKKSSAKLSIVDVDSYALARAVCLSTTVQATKTKIILDISSSVARLMLLHQNEIIFHQIISHDHEKLKHAIQLCLSSYHQFTICTIFLSGSEEESLSIIHFLKETFQ